MDISQTLTQTNTPISQPQAEIDVARSQIDADFDLFLQMLTAQAKYQDPLDPMDNSEYATQLATFSGVEQAVLTNDLLLDLTTQLSGGSLADMAALVGKEALAPVPAYFDGAPLTLTPKPTVIGDETALIVSDLDRNILQRQVIPANSETVTWAGVDENGEPMASGLYQFSVETTSFGEVIATDPIEVYTRINEVRFDNGSTTLLLEGGASVDSNDITSLRDPV